MWNAKTLSRGVGWILLAACLAGNLATGQRVVADDAPAGKPAAPDAVSFYKQVRPIFQAHCQGCHQPAKAGGDYVMTTFERLIQGGESKEAAIVAKNPDDSYLIEQITPVDGKAAMPFEKAPLTGVEIETVRKWIAQGAVDDTPVTARIRYDQEHPPVYSRPPVITAMDISPDGSLLAVGGFHEVLLWKSDGSEMVARLVGLSERIESVRFSPTGDRLAVTGGQPGRMGEVQVWDVAKRKLSLSVPVTFDTVYGASWSPDGTKLSFGCADNTVRAIDAKTGEQLLSMLSHTDWALDTVFSVEGTHVISVGRDMAVKLTEFATQRFVDNITSITPGALKGGIASVARHPKRDEIVVGGSDGQPKLYRVFRQVTRVIGDDSNLIREFPSMPGRVFSVVVSADGKRIAAASSLDGSAGQVSVFGYEFDTSLPDNIKAIMAKVASTRSAQENETLSKYHHDGVTQISQTSIEKAGVYALAFHPDGKLLVAAGGDGIVRLIDAEKGAIVKTFEPAPLARDVEVASTVSESARPVLDEAVASETLAEGIRLSTIEVEPKTIQLDTPFAYAQLLVSGRTADGQTIDVTRMADFHDAANLLDLDRSGLARPRKDGEGVLEIRLQGKSISVPISVSNAKTFGRVDFIHDVAPVLSKLGCNAGTCHGAAQGKNGFKLSLRGYDPLFDVRALVDDHASRRVHLASPDDSLMLLKSTGAVPHVGGQLIRPGEPNYAIIRNWIADGARFVKETPRVARINVYPVNPIVESIGARQQLRVVATYASGEVRDVSREAFLESGNSEVATANRQGLITAVRRGEAPVLVRYEGAYAATTMTVMGDRSGFAWIQPPANNKVDELTAAKWQRMKILPSDLCDDTEFLRRIYLDLTGLPPTIEDVRGFLADKRESRVKREAVVDRLIGSSEFIDFWTNKWADLLQVNRKFLDVEGAVAFRDWIRKQVAENLPYDQFVKAIVTATGSNHANPAASYFKILRDPAATMENTTQLFLAVRFNCNKCHDHPFERWTQDQYYQTAAYFARTSLKEDPESKGRRIGGTAVEGAKPLYEVVYDKTDGEIKHERTSLVTEPKFPFDCSFKAPEHASRRQEIASWLTSSDNPYFAKSYVNRLWGYLMGVGIIEPIDDIRAGNPATNPELLDYLTSEFIKSGFNVRHVMRLITTSRTYQLSVATNKWNQDDKLNYSHAQARRLPAEVLLDTVYRVTGSTSKFPGVTPGTRAAALPDSGVELPSGFLTTFGRPARESACECERSSGMQLGPVMALVSGPTLGEAIADPSNEIAKLVGREGDDEKLIGELFLRILNRPATPAELKACREDVAEIESDHRKLAETLGKAEMEFALARPKLERDREAAIAQAETAVAAREKEIAPRVAEEEKARVARIAKLEADLKAYDAKLAENVAAWEKKQSPQSRWRTLVPKAVTDPNGAKFTTLPDGSILVSGKDEAGEITFVAETDLTDVTGVRLELMTDPSLPNRGPGRAQDGNFVLNEFKLNAASKADPKQRKAVTFTKPLADFSQQNFDVRNAVDGSPNPGKGWAVSPSNGVTHWATFETGDKVGFSGGTTLTFKLIHRFQGSKFMPGRFRISLTRGAGPIGLTLSEELREIVATAQEVRTAAQNETLMAYHRSVDAEHRRIQSELAQSRAPLPVDPKLLSLRNELAEAKKPVAVDPSLVQLRQDVEMSIKQAAARRLTAAQDIAWALINSPAFLFNH